MERTARKNKIRNMQTQTYAKLNRFTTFYNPLVETLLALWGGVEPCYKLVLAFFNIYSSFIISLCVAFLCDELGVSNTNLEVSYKRHHVKLGVSNTNLEGRYKK